MRTTAMILQVQSYDLGMWFFDHQSYCEGSGFFGNFDIGFLQHERKRSEYQLTKRNYKRTVRWHMMLFAANICLSLYIYYIILMFETCVCVCSILLIKPSKIWKAFNQNKGHWGSRCVTFLLLWYSSYIYIHTYILNIIHTIYIYNMYIFILHVVFLLALH